MRLKTFWSVGHATRIGLTAGFAALLLWPAYATWQAPVRELFVAALTVTAFCGASILFISAIDLLTVTRSRAVLPARLFDLALGAMLAIPSGAALADLFR